MRRAFLGAAGFRFREDDLTVAFIVLDIPGFFFATFFFADVRTFFAFSPGALVAATSLEFLVTRPTILPATFPILVAAVTRRPDGFVSFVLLVIGLSFLLSFT